MPCWNWLHQGPDQAIVDDVQVISQKHCTNEAKHLPYCMNNMTVKVYKFGGTSVGTVEKIQAIADRILAEPDHQHVVVVSAMGHTTDQLVELCSQISTTPEPREYDALISTGENVSAALLSMSRSEGRECHFIDWPSSGYFYKQRLQTC